MRRLPELARIPRVVALVLLAFGGSARAQTPGPELHAISPAVLAPFQSARLEIRGQGFDEDTRVLIEGVSPGRFMSYQPELLSPERCTVELPLGFGPRPPIRDVVIETRNGARSHALPLTIREMVTEPLDADAPESESGGVPIQIEDVVSGGPALREIRPATAPAGRAFRLELLGGGFAEGAHVEVVVNVHAGSSKLPEYRPQSFRATRLGEDLLEVSFERGFYPVPGARDLRVVNPDGTRSETRSLRIDQEETKP